MKKLLLLNAALLLFFGFANAQKRANISPATGSKGQTLSVTFTGVNTTFNQGSNTVQFFRQGSPTTSLSMSNLSASSATSLTGTLTISQSTVIGLFTFKIFNLADTVVNGQNSFTVTNSSSTSLVSVAPNSGNKGQTLNVTITGSGTHFNQGSNTIQFRQGTQTGYVNINSLTPLNATQLSANITIQNSAPTGNYTLLANNPTDGLMTLLNAFSVNSSGGGSASLVSVTPNTGKRGQQLLNITLTGRNTNFSQASQTTVSFLYQGNPTTDVTAPPFTFPIDDTTIFTFVTISSTAALGVYTVVVDDDIDGTLTLANSFTVADNPNPAKLLSISPATGSVGQTVNITVTAQNTAFLGGFQSISIQNQVGDFVTATGVTATSNTVLTGTLQIPDTVGTGLYSLTVFDLGGGLLELADVFTVTNSNGIIEKTKDDTYLSVYPNPAKDKLTISSKQAHIERVELFDLKGKLVYNINTNSIQIELNLAEMNLAKQVYLVKIQTKNAYKTQRLMVE